VVRVHVCSRPAGAALDHMVRHGHLWSIHDGVVSLDGELSDPRRGPRSRRAFGVGDVGGERRGDPGANPTI
jgi:hypothetical protein